MLQGVFFVQEQLFFEVYTAGGGETAEFAVASDYTMAGDNQRQGIFCKCVSNGPTGVWPSQFLRQSCVRYCLAEPNLPAGDKDIVGESVKAIEFNGNIQGKIHTFTLEISGNLFLEVFKIEFFGSCLWNILQQSGFDSFIYRLGKFRPADSRIGAGEAEITPFCLENYIFDGFLHFSP